MSHSLHKFIKILYPFFEMNEDQNQLTYYDIVTMRTENSVGPD